MVEVPPNVFVADAAGLLRWQSVIEAIGVRPAYKAVVLTCTQGDARHFSLSPEHARHLARLLDDAADKVDPK